MIGHFDYLIPGNSDLIHIVIDSIDIIISPGTDFQGNGSADIAAQLIL